MDHQIISFPYIFSFLLFLIALFKVFKKLYGDNSNNPPPGPWKLPILGNILQISAVEEFHVRLAELAKTYGSVMRINVGQVPFLIISSSDAAKEVLKTQDPIFADRPLVLAAELVLYNRNGITFSPYGDYWRQMRKYCALELLSAKRVQSFRPIREEEVGQVVKNLRSNEGSPVNLSHILVALSNSIILRDVVGHKYRKQEKLLQTMDEAFAVSSGINTADIFPSFKWLPFVQRERARIWNVHKQTDEILEDLLQEHRANREAAFKNGIVFESDNLLDVLLDLQQSGNLDIPLTDSNIKGIIVELFGAGSDTSSRITEWAMAELMRHPDTMKKVQEEVRGLFGKTGYVEETKLQELKWLKLIIKETMRLHPPAALFPRLCREKTKVNGYDINAGTRVFINVSAIGRDPKVWNQAEKFIPERFIGSPIDYKGNNFELIPFGAGKKVCPGMTLGTANIESTLSNLLYHFDWKFPQGVTAQNLDMTECYGLNIKRKVDLQLIPIAYHS